MKLTISQSTQGYNADLKRVQQWAEQELKLSNSREIPGKPKFCQCTRWFVLWWTGTLALGIPEGYLNFEIQEVNIGESSKQDYKKVTQIDVFLRHYYTYTRAQGGEEGHCQLISEANEVMLDPPQRRLLDVELTSQEGCSAPEIRDVCAGETFKHSLDKVINNWRPPPPL